MPSHFLSHLVQCCFSKHSFLKLFMQLFLGMHIFGTPLHSLVLDISHGHVAPIPLALTATKPDSPTMKSLSSKIDKVIQQDIQFSGLFQFVDPKAFIQTTEDLHKNGPRFEDWRVINAQALTRLTLSEKDEDKQIKLTFFLYDTMSQKELEGIAIRGPKNQWRRMAHRISDSIYSRLTGDEGLFDTQIVYVHESGSRVNRKRRLALMDQDGANHQFITPQTDSIVLTPRLSPSGKRLVYLDYGAHNKVPRVQIMDMSSFKHQTLGHFPGMTFAPRFSPDGKKVIMSLARDGNSALYEMNLVTRHVIRLTYGEHLDTSPCYSPDGKKVTFNTNRSGNQQIFLMDADGGNMHRISYGPGRYATPVWSPRGDWIAFTKMYKGAFYIGVMRPDGTGERLITTGDVVEDPSWSTNGRLILFTRTNPRRHGKTNLFAIDLTGFNERQIRTSGEGSGASWSRVNIMPSS